MFQGSFRPVSRTFQGCFKKFQGCFKSISAVIHGSFKGVCKQVSSGFNRVLRKLQCSFQGFSKVFQLCFKEDSVLRQLSRCFKVVSFCITLIAASRAEGGLVQKCLKFKNIPKVGGGEGRGQP